MTKTIDNMIAEAAKTGRLTGITIWPGNDGSWGCNVKRRTLDGNEGWACVRHVDPVEGVKIALSQAVKVQAIIDRPPLQTKGVDWNAPDPAPAPAKVPSIFD